MIRRWVALWDGQEHGIVLALVRIAVGGLVAIDLLRAASLGLVTVLWAPAQAGGLRVLEGAHLIPEVYLWFPWEPGTAWVVWGITAAAALCFALGLFTRISGVVLLLGCAQLAMILPGGDRGIDTLLRNVVFILCFSRCGAVLSVDCARRTGSWWSDVHVPRWPRRMIILQLAVVYFLSGVSKVAAPWLPAGGFSALYYVFHDLQITRYPPPNLAAIYPLTQLATALALLWEWTFPLLLVLHRRWGRWPDPRLLWLGYGVAFHLALAVTMRLGIFPWAMMALYPVFFTPDEVLQALRRLSSRMNPRSSSETGTT